MNTETKFTPRIAPAPWTWEKDKPLLAADGQLVNGVSRTNEQLANHRAMLAAAPKMFEALKNSALAIDCMVQMYQEAAPYGQSPLVQKAIATLNEARAALAKATAESESCERNAAVPQAYADGRNK